MQKNTIDNNLLGDYLLQTDQYKSNFSALELFAGAGGMALGFEEVGFQHVLLNDMNKHCCETLKLNRPNWPIKQADIQGLDFHAYHKKVDVVIGGFPCQAFSFAGKKQGLSDQRGQLFFEFARAIREIQPAMFIAENVKGLLHHKQGETIDIILKTLSDLGYHVSVKLMKAIYHRVPQKRERVFIVGIRNDHNIEFKFPDQEEKVYSVRDALCAGKLFNCNVPKSPGFQYSEAKQEVLSQVSINGNWRDLPIDLQKSYLGKYYGKGSNAQVAQRLSWDEPCKTLLANPNAKLTERCHPEKTRPLTVREYARIQTFPDTWQFTGSISSQYRQIANAVPVNLAKAVALSAKECLEQIKQSISSPIEVRPILH